jgi:hypothetical protein
MPREALLRVAQGCCMLTGAAIATVSAWESTPLGIPGVETALGAFALAFLAAAGAEQVADRTVRATLSLAGGALFLVVAVGPTTIAILGALGLLLVGAALLADSVRTGFPDESRPL